MNESERTLHATPTPGVLQQRVGDEIVLVHPATNQIYALNPTGAALWQLLPTVSDRRALVAALVERFDATADEIERDVDRLLAELAGHGLTTQA